MERRLTDEEHEALVDEIMAGDNGRNGEGTAASAGIDAGAEAQARKLVEWLSEECHIHHLEGRWEMDVDWPKRHECSDCMEQLRREVGLDATS